MSIALDLPFVVKICGITSVEDAQVALDAGANALGFNFYPKSPRYISPARAAEILDLLPSSFLRVGIFVNPESWPSEVSLDVLQVHGDRPIPDAFGRRIWKAHVPGNSMPTELGTIEAFLLDGLSPNHGGSGKTFDWKLAASFPYRKIIAGGLDASNVAEAIRIAMPWGVDANSRLESAPGKKDPVRVRAFVRAALEAIHQEIVAP